jgi:glutathione S-transferase
MAPSLLPSDAVTFVDLEEARAARGLRLVIAGGVPSPWSQGAMGVFDVKGLEYLAVRFRRDSEDIKRWTGVPNAPVALYDDEPPRAGWAEILALAERLGGRRSLVPADADARVRLHGLAHEILGEGGLAWNVRLLLVHASFETNGQRGWPLPVARYLAPRYGYAAGDGADQATTARTRTIDALGLLDRTLAESHARGHEYLLGDGPTALDVYSAVGLGPVVPQPHELCPMLPPVRHAFETLDADVRAAASPALVAHRDLMFARHLVLPVRL